MKTLLVITGPTAVGKTELSIHLARLLSSAILSADSRQIYQEMKIGTAAPTDEQLSKAKHYFIGQFPLEHYYSAAMFEEDALQVLDKLFQHDDIAMMTGGSMMYIDAVCNGIDDMPTVEGEIREMMQRKLKKEGSEALLQQLKVFDPVYYQQVDKKNTKRVVHALEICYQTGKPFSCFRTGKMKERPFKIVKVAVNRNRDALFQRINLRVELMIQQGLFDEARLLYPKRHLNALNTVGYKEFFQVLEGNWDLSFAIEKIKKNTRDYAKKQLTWIKKSQNYHWIDMDHQNMETASQNILNLLDLS